MYVCKCVCLSVCLSVCVIDVMRPSAQGKGTRVGMKNFFFSFFSFLCDLCVYKSYPI